MTSSACGLKSRKPKGSMKMQTVRHFGCVKAADPGCRTVYFCTLISLEGGYMQTKNINLRIREDLFDAFDRISEISGLTKTKLFKNAAEEYLTLADQKKEPETARITGDPKRTTCIIVENSLYEKLLKYSKDNRLTITQLSLRIIRELIIRKYIPGWQSSEDDRSVPNLTDEEVEAIKNAAMQAEINRMNSSTITEEERKRILKLPDQVLKEILKITDRW